ncbi:DUF1345 domain-containing protein [Flavobacterium bomense]|uniref:DUF1345 domain-containing protein n=1 Tax=Flavobacterium bomense TaxID=2497483 RepID=A0A3S0MCH9_9FLAO|nr:DUF1345 domain-containing protein [Flavobacterium bomense]RTZ02750.1 DUF1345 domain-containing protein [Flavobacterium bomense]
MENKLKHHWIEKISGINRLIISLLFSLITYSILFAFNIDNNSKIILSWDAFCVTGLFFSWVLFFSTKENELCHIVAKQDENLKTIFSIVIIAIVLSLFGTLALVNEKKDIIENRLFHSIVSLSPVVFSWLLLHTTFTIRYAHLYHDHNELNTGSNIGGIKFPGKTKPDYLDFAYFSFVIGMTFQVSDVVITSKTIRRFALMHSLISFAYNTIIVALTISTISNLKQ